MQKRRVVTPELESAIQRISKARAFKRSDIIGGKELNRIEWAHASRDYKELRKVYAMNVFIKCRREGTPARKAYEKAAQTVGRANGNHVNWQTVRGWVMGIRADARQAPARSARSPCEDQVVSRRPSDQGAGDRVAPVAVEAVAAKECGQVPTHARFVSGLS